MLDGCGPCCACPAVHFARRGSRGCTRSLIARLWARDLVHAWPPCSLCRSPLGILTVARPLRPQPLFLLLPTAASAGPLAAGGFAGSPGGGDWAQVGLPRQGWAAPRESRRRLRPALCVCAADGAAPPPPHTHPSHPPPSAASWHRARPGPEAVLVYLHVRAGLRACVRLRAVESRR